jgi:arginine repressor
MGAEAFNHSLWIFTSSSMTLYEKLQTLNVECRIFSQSDISLKQKELVISEMVTKVDIHIPDSMYRLLMDSYFGSVNYLKLFLRENLGDLTLTAMPHFVEVLEKAMHKLEKTHGKALVRKFFALVAFARNGLNDKSMMEMLDLRIIRWNYAFKDLQNYVKRNNEGLILPYDDQFSEFTVSRYIPDAQDQREIHSQLANHFLNQSSVSEKVNDSNIIEIPYHLYYSEADVNQITEYLCNIPYLVAVFKRSKSDEMNYFLTETLKRAKNAPQNVRAILAEYIFFVEKYDFYLRSYPQSTLTLALNLPEGICRYLRFAAREFQKHNVEIVHLDRLSISEEQLELSNIGEHEGVIILIGFVFITSEKQFIAVDSKGTLTTYDMRSFTKDRVFLESCMGDDEVVECCFNPKKLSVIAFGTRNNNITVFDFMSSKKLYHFDGIYEGGVIFFSEIEEGMWIKQKKVWTKLQISDPLAESSILATSSVICRSLDGTRLAYICSRKNRSLVIFSTKTMKEICRFKENNISDHTIGRFSNNNDVIGLYTNVGIMVFESDLDMES